MGLTESLVLSRRYCWISADFRGLSLKLLFKFHSETKEMYLDALFPGVTVEEVRADIPWDQRREKSYRPAQNGCDFSTWFPAAV